MKNDHIPKTTLSCDPTEKKQPQKCQKPTVSSKITHQWFFKQTKKPTKTPWFSNISPWKINMEHNHIEVWFRSFSFLNGWFVGSSRSSSRVFRCWFFFGLLWHFYTPSSGSPSHPRIPARPWRSMDLQHQAGYLDTLGQRGRQWCFFPTKNVEIFAYIYIYDMYIQLRIYTVYLYNSYNPLRLDVFSTYI